jgi:diguanylate cyclase
MALHYTEATETSAELLRLALPRMAQHGGPYHPTVYAVWYQHLAGMNPPLTQALERAQASAAGMKLKDLEQIHDRFITGVNAQSLLQLQEGLKSLMGRLDGVASDSVQHTTQYTETLAACRRELETLTDQTLLIQLVDRLAKQTEAATSNAQAMQMLVAESSQALCALNTQLAKAQTEAERDPLTNLLNRRGFERKVRDLANSIPDGFVGCSLLMIDIDRFKHINDKYGHLIGDQVINAIAGVLHSGVKGQDIVGRFGGDEFVILLPGTDVEGATALAENLRRSVGRARIQGRTAGTGKFTDSINISLGVAAGVPGELIDELILRADTALRNAKQQGRNCVMGAAAPKDVVGGA